MNCTTACVSTVEIPGFGDNCAQVTRDTCKSKLVLLRCDQAIPTGDADTISAALETLITAGSLGATPKLKDFNWGDPQTTDFAFDDCSPAVPVVTQRELTGSDFHSFEEDASGMPVPFFDRDFWNSVTQGQFFNFGWTTCDGNLYWAATDRNYTKLMKAVLVAFQTEDKTLANKCMEVKKFILRFMGDPMKYFPKPYLDLAAQEAAFPLLKTLY